MKKETRPEVLKILNKNDQELRGYIIERASRIENRIDQLIIDCFEINSFMLFRDVVLNSQVINAGAKLRIVDRLDLIDNKDCENIRKIYAIRNYFAHAHIQGPLNLTITQGDISQNIDYPRLIRYANSSFEIKYSSIEDMITEFYDRYKKLTIFSS